MNNSTILGEITGNQRSCDDKIGLGYKKNFVKGTSFMIRKGDEHNSYAEIVKESIRKQQSFST